MKRFYTIGRDGHNDIAIHDESNVISRQHAILEIGRFGKYYIVDKSQNGTYINGIKVSHNVKIPVTRKDVVSFARVADLDWTAIPRDKTVWYIISSALALLLVVALSAFISRQLSNMPDMNTRSNTGSVVPGGNAPGSIVAFPPQTEPQPGVAPPSEPVNPPKAKKDTKKASSKKEEPKKEKVDPIF